MDYLDTFKRFMVPGCGKELTDLLAHRLEQLNFFDAPASVSHHGNVSGGLFTHSYAVAKVLVELTEKLNLQWQNKRSPYLVGMLHDICKCDNYVQPDCGDPEHWEYNNASILPGHGDKSVIMLQQITPITDEELACIRWHMGAFDDKSNWNSYGRACTTYPNVLWTHTADMVAARILGV